MNDNKQKPPTQTEQPAPVATTLRLFLIYWYYFWGHAASKPMYWLDWGWLYKYYNAWMTKSAEYDTHFVLWKKPGV